MNAAASSDPPPDNLVTLSHPLRQDSLVDLSVEQILDELSVPATSRLM